MIYGMCWAENANGFSLIGMKSISIGALRKCTFNSSSNSKLPLSFSWQSLTHPLTECLGIIVTDMYSRIWHLLFYGSTRASWLCIRVKSYEVQKVTKATNSVWLVPCLCMLKNFEHPHTVSKLICNVPNVFWHVLLISN